MSYYLVQTLTETLQGRIMDINTRDDRQKRQIHTINVINRSSNVGKQADIHCGDILEFQVNGKHDYDISQVYKDGDDYYRIDDGYELLNINHDTPKHERRMLLSIDLCEDEPDIDIYFCVIRSSQYEAIFKTRKCPREYCEHNCLRIEKHIQEIVLSDEAKNQKLYLHKGDTIELKWSSESGTAYHIEEKKYCPKSGGFYTPEQRSNTISTNSQYRRTFHELDMIFLFRLTATKQIHDITVCVINSKYGMKQVKITDNQISQNIIRIERNDWILFQWNTGYKPIISQIKPSNIDENQQRLIEVCILLKEE